jgi:hypothetical protein
MGLSMSQRKAVTKQLATRYQHAHKGERGRMLNEFTSLTGYTRSYASFVLRNWGRKRILTLGGVRTIYVFGQERKRKPTRRVRTYDKAVVKPLTQLWALSGGLCGKRLAVFIRTTLPVLERFEELVLSAEVRDKLRRISPASIDRVLAPERKKFQLKGRSTTKPGSLLKHHIPIRTFSEWNEQTPGFVEIDLVAHDGGIPGADVIHTLDLTDVCTTWTETRALKTKARRWVLEALREIRAQLPFALKGIDSDNGGEFINTELVQYCDEERLSFTRSRPYRKNDSCFVEQKNYSIVRKTVGYDRYDTNAEHAVLVKLYAVLRLFTNFFQPVMKLKQKTREGSKVRKLYDTPQTPYARVLAHPAVDQRAKSHLQHHYRQLNPAALRREIAHLQEKLCMFTQRKRTMLHNQHRQKRFSAIFT